MLTIYSSEKDKYNFHISDKPLEVNSCGVNGSVGKSAPRNSFYVRRPDGRKDYQLLYISAGKAAIDGLPCEKPDKLVEEGAKISLRGMGKIKLSAVNGRTKKDRISVIIHRYV